MESLQRAVKLTVHYSIQMKSTKQVDVTGTFFTFKKWTRFCHAEHANTIDDDQSGRFSSKLK